LSYRGDFSNDEPSYGDYYWRDNPYPENRFDILQYEDGYYFGETFYGEPQGKGVFIHLNKDLWFGDWLNGVRYNGIELKYDGTVNIGLGSKTPDDNGDTQPNDETVVEDEE
jgi:hypothetical protein